MKALIPIGFVLVFLIGILPLHGQKLEDAFYQSDTLEVRKKVQILGLPIIFYTPETQFGIGGGLQLFFRTKTNIYNSRLSNLFVDAIYTTQNQFIVDAKPQLYFQKGDYYLDGAFKFKIFPNSFWGIGNLTSADNLEKYNMRSTTIRAAFLKRLPPSLNFGFEYRFENHVMLAVKEGGILASEDVEGFDGARSSGLFMIFNLDNRDNVYSAKKGYFMQLNAGFSSLAFGGTHSYNKYIIDLRKYVTLVKNHVLAFQIYTENNFGDTPFQNKAWLGGSEKNRGYFKGRFMDDHMYAAQVEYRWRFLPRWSLAAFLSTGEVAELPQNFFDDLKSSFGGGIRFQVIRKNPTLLRLDFGLGSRGNSGIYFGVNEAF